MKTLLYAGFCLFYANPGMLIYSSLALRQMGPTVYVRDTPFKIFVLNNLISFLSYIICQNMIFYWNVIQELECLVIGIHSIGLLINASDS